MPKLDAQQLYELSLLGANSLSFKRSPFLLMPEILQGADFKMALQEFPLLQLATMALIESCKSHRSDMLEPKNTVIKR